MPPFAGARSFGYYTAELSGVIRGFKFLGRRNLAGLLAPLLARVFHDTWTAEEFDLIVPIPLHARRKRERGYNQSELLARSLAGLVAVPCAKNVLVRTRPTLPQVGLSDARRLENVRGAFRCPNPVRAAGKRILLIDDVMTTGATAGSAARALLDAGALRVSILTAARAVR
jgi:ComF family protein